MKKFFFSLLLGFLPVFSASATQKQFWGLMNVDYFNAEETSRYRIQVQPRSDDVIAGQDTQNLLERVEVQLSGLYRSSLRSFQYWFGPGLTVITPLTPGTRGEVRPYFEQSFRRPIFNYSSFNSLMFEVRTRLEARFQEDTSLVPRARFFPRVKWRPFLSYNSHLYFESGIEVFVPLRTTLNDRGNSITQAWVIDQIRYLPLNVGTDLMDQRLSIAFGVMIRRTLSPASPPLNTWVTLLAFTYNLKDHSLSAEDEASSP